ncbi:MAG: hypothetical protein ABIH23_10775 [bacterium]
MPNKVLIPVLLILAASTLTWGAAEEPVVYPAIPKPENEETGQRPYEMVQANRAPIRKPTIDFDSLEGWTVECFKGAQARLHPSSEQRVWDSNTGKLTYKGDSEESYFVLRPPSPVPLGQDVECVNVWVYGNNIGWAPDPSTPQVHIFLLASDKENREYQIELTRVNWKEWWLVHRKIDTEAAKQLVPGGKFTGIQITGCANKEDRTLFFEDLIVYKEDLKPLSFDPRPKRGIDPFPGQSPGANVGPGRLPFPTREETILPANLERRFRNKVTENDDGSFQFTYRGKDAELKYVLHPGQRDLGCVEVFLNGSPVAVGLAGAGVTLETPPDSTRLSEAVLKDGIVRLVWTNGVESHLRIQQKSLVVDFFCSGGNATELQYGKITEVTDPEIIQLPYMNYRRHHLGILMIKGIEPCFASIWMDWYRSNGSKPFARDEITPDGIYLNGGVQYVPRTDGVRNGLYERFFFTVSPVFEETLATIANPPAKEGMLAGQRLWQESWGPGNYETEMERSRKLRAYGIEMLTQCNHEITWRDDCESFTFRLQSAPKRGGDEALRAYIQHQKSLGWRSGLYTNYCDFAPVNGMWDEDWVMRDEKGDWVRAWHRCYSPKVLRAVEADAELAPKIHEKFGSNAAYTDVHTSVSPWDRTDYDARVPGAGTFASTFYAYGELLLHDQEVYDGHMWSEGNHQWLYAGLATGNYGLTYSNLNLWEYPYLPHFDLLKMHPLEVDMGVPWTAGYFQRCEGWQDAGRIEYSIDKFIAATIAYGHIGWLVEEGYGMRRTCRSYYMLQQLQSRYVMRAPEEILYGGKEGLISTSQALLNGEWRNSRMFVRYPDDLRIWINGNDEIEWCVDVDGTSVNLPPSGWIARQGEDFFEQSCYEDGHRVDRVGSPGYVYVDGRGKETSCDGVRSAGAVAVRPSEEGLSIIPVEGVDKVGIGEPQQRYSRGDVRRAIRDVARSKNLSVEAFNIDGNSLGEASIERDQDGWVIHSVPDAIRYEVTR